MQSTLTITLSLETKATLDTFTQAQGITSDELVLRAIEDYLFVKKFKSLRSQMLQKTHEHYTDEDIFELVS
jgi:predicted DNA-binding protein